MSELVLASRRTDLRTLDDKMAYAQQLAESGNLPAQYRKNPANVLWAVEYGQMLNLEPMAAITGVHMIEGKPSASAGLMSSLVRCAGHKLRVFGDDTKATAQIIRIDDPEFIFEVTWTIAKAKTAELLGKKNWRLYPESMLKARAVSQVARDACEEVLFGLHYTPEELGVEDTNEDGEPITVTSVRTDTPANNSPAAGLIVGLRADILAATSSDELRCFYDKATEAGFTGQEATTDADENPVTLAHLIRTTRERLAPTGTSAEEPVDAEIVDEEPTPPAPADPVDGATWGKINSLFGHLPVDVNTPAKKLTLTRELIGRYIDTGKDLTQSEALDMIATMEAMLAKDGCEALFAEMLENPQHAQPSLSDAA